MRMGHKKADEMSELRRGLLMVIVPPPMVILAMVMMNSGIFFLQAVGTIAFLGVGFVGGFTLPIGLIHIVYGLIEESKK